MATEQAGKKHKEPVWLLYLSALLSGIVLLAEAVNYYPLQKISARLGIALVYSAMALFVANGRRSGYAAAVLIWAVTILTFFI